MHHVEDIFFRLFQWSNNKKFVIATFFSPFSCDWYMNRQYFQPFIAPIRTIMKIYDDCLFTYQRYYFLSNTLRSLVSLVSLFNFCMLSIACIVWELLAYIQYRNVCGSTRSITCSVGLTRLQIVQFVRVFGDCLHSHSLTHTQIWNIDIWINCVEAIKGLCHFPAIIPIIAIWYVHLHKT